MTRKIQIMAICFIALAFFVTGVTVSPTPALAFKVAIVLPGTITDESFCQSGYEGLKLIEKELGAEIAYSERVSEADQVENIRD